MGKLHAHARVALQAKELDHSREVESLRRRLDSVLAQHDAASDDFRAREARASEALGHQASALASLQQRHQEEVASLQEKVRAPPPAQALLCGEHHGATSNQEHGKQNTIMPHVWNLYL